jgi:hypothetical protein
MAVGHFFAPILLGQRSYVSVDDAHLQFVFAVQDGFRKQDRILAANQDIPFEIHFPGWEDHPNGQKRDYEAF